jgi:hypothetical protein
MGRLVVVLVAVVAGTHDLAHPGLCPSIRIEHK